MSQRSFSSLISQIASGIGESRNPTVGRWVSKTSTAVNLENLIKITQISVNFIKFGNLLAPVPGLERPLFDLDPFSGHL